MRYNYVCDKCNNTETRELKVSQVSEKQYCSKCNNELRRVFNSFGLKTNDGYKS